WETRDDARAALTRAVQVAANLYRDKRLIQKLIDAGADVNAEPVLVIATAHCDAELVSVLLRAGVDPAQAYRDQSALENSLTCYEKASPAVARQALSQLVAANRQSCREHAWRKPPSNEALALLSELCN